MIFHLQDNVYGHPVVIATRPDASTKAVKRYLRAHLPFYSKLVSSGDIHKLRAHDGMTTRFEGMQLTIVFLKNEPRDPQSIADLAHELIHVAADVFVHAGVNFTSGNDEAIAYYVGFLVKGVLEKFAQQNG